MFATPTSTTSRLRRSRLAPLLVGTAMLFAACGSATDTADAPGVAALPEATESAAAPDSESTDSNKTEDSGDGETSDLSPEEAQLAFSQCLEEQGVDDPFGGDGGEAIGDNDEDGPGSAAIQFESEEDFEAFEKAQEACSELLGDAFGEFEATPEQEAMMADAELKFNQCMSDKGFEVSEGGIEINEGDFEKMEEAAADCDDAFDELNDLLADEGEDN